MRTLIITLPLAAMLSALAGLANAQDIADGQKSFNKCRACHTVGENAKNGVGPVLNGLFGRKAGTIDGFKYSDANKNSGVVWDEKTSQPTSRIRKPSCRAIVWRSLASRTIRKLPT